MLVSSSGWLRAPPLYDAVSFFYFRAHLGQFVCFFQRTCKVKESFLVTSDSPPWELRSGPQSYCALSDSFYIFFVYN